MKSDRFLVMAALLLLCFSCQKADAPEEEIDALTATELNILGNWTGTNVDYLKRFSTPCAPHGCWDYTVEGVTIAHDFDLNFLESGDLQSNGTYDMDFHFSGNDVEDPYDWTETGLRFLENGSWDIVGEELFVVTGQDTVVAIIEELTDNTLRLSLNRLIWNINTAETRTTFKTEATFTR